MEGDRAHLDVDVDSDLEMEDGSAVEVVVPGCDGW